MAIQDFSRFRFVSTRYMGSKRRSINWIFSHLKDLSYDTCLDACAGTGVISFEFKKRGKRVHFNDILRSNFLSGKALIENSRTRLSHSDIEFVINKHNDIKYPNFIVSVFNGMFFTREENHWLDVAIRNITQIEDPYKQALAFHCVFQAALVKRPFNLFHRNNLYIRLAKIKRTFGNAGMWEKPFDFLFKKFAMEANSAVFDNGRRNTATNNDIFEFKQTNYDLVYLDSPFLCTNGAGTDYFDLYGFLEGLSNYSNWRHFLQYRQNLIAYRHNGDWWTRKRTIDTAFEIVFKSFRNSIIVVSYRAPGTPSQTELHKLLSNYKRKISVHTIERQYALSKDRTSKELLLIGR